MRDRRKGFCFQTVEAMEAIRGRWSGSELTSAIALYQSMTDLANRRRHDGGREGFEASRPEIARFAGMSPRTVDKYAQELEQLGLLSVHRERREDGLNLPNVWVLEDPEGGATTAPGWRNRCATRSETTAPGVAQPLRQGGATAAHGVKEERQEERQEETPIALVRGSAQEGEGANTIVIPRGASPRTVSRLTRTAERLGARLVHEDPSASLTRRSA